MMSFDPATVDIDALLKRLHLANTRRCWRQLTEQAATDQWSPRDFLAILLAEPKKAKRQRELPVWAFHGAKDDAVKLAESEKMVNALRQIGNNAKLTIYPDAGHDSWTESYNNPALYEWFLQHQNPNTAVVRRRVDTSWRLALSPRARNSD